VFQIMPSGQVSATVSARRLIVQEGGLYNGDFRMIQDAPRETMSAGLASWQDLAGKEPEESPLDTLNSDEWWRKFAGSEAPEGALHDEGDRKTEEKKGD
jgi:hypothetical protein